MSACELKRQAKLEHWRTQIIDCRSSGMSVKGWCAEHNISTKTYYRWEKEILSSAATELVPTVSAPQPPAAFAELPSQLERQTGGRVIASIQIGKGKADIYSGADATVVRAICQGLMGWRLWCSNSFSWTHSPIRCFCSAADGGTASRDSTGSGMDSSCCISGWNRARTNGRERKMKRGS